MGSALGIIAGEMVAAHDASMQAAQRSAGAASIEAASIERRRGDSDGVEESAGAGRAKASRLAALCLPDHVVMLLPAVLQMVAVLFAGMLLIYFDSGQDITLARAFYYAVITGTTIG